MQARSSCEEIRRGIYTIMGIDVATGLAMQARCNANRKRETLTDILNDVPAKAVTREADLHQQIIDECRRRGWIPLHGAMHVRAMRPQGEPDFVIVADNGVTLMVECKKKGGKLSPEQHAMRHHLLKLKAKYLLCYSFEEFLQFITYHTSQ